MTGEDRQVRSILFDRIGLLYTGDPAREEIEDAALVVEDGEVVWVGPTGAAPCADERVDTEGRCVIPGFVDSHAHLVFAGDRTAEFAARMAGRPYTAGGIRTTVSATRAASDVELVTRTAALVSEMLTQGTTTLEIKSGYGLTVEDERRSLEIARGFTEETTYLGAHVVPPDASSADEYVRTVTGEMLEACAPHARWVDVFCERGAFDADQSREILLAGMKAGLLPRIHANQLGEGPGARIAAEVGAASADHCTHLTDDDVSALSSAGVVATLLPGAEFSTRSPYPDARRLLDAGVTVALATDCNPGSSFTSSMPFCVALAVREMRMTPLEAIRAATYGGARALRRGDVGTLRVGTRGNLVILDAPTYVHLAYRPGVPLVTQVWKEGRRLV
ncbi:imidazolonepropionase [Streptosporangium sp. NBC_01755]|uniref:imidazolonepropionase n=1 Tax=unclassified Streptosporangium TaxID=2632669 RepID=UPI002DDC2233|nr:MULTISPECIES: imidazolonepropionase [unclassified Streptosporangium]WSA23824.1 imidazolonepropionase [Streptosporangium sp. NBC_01810]WSC98104.1 imidazolonepropionase [Streptosporangium sp. NBC_01755]